MRWFAAAVALTSSSLWAYAAPIRADLEMAAEQDRRPGVNMTSKISY